MTEHQAPNSEHIQAENFFSIRKQIVDSILLLGTLLGVITSVLFAFNISGDSWQISEIALFMLILVWIGITVLRNKIPYSFKAILIIVFMYIVGLVGIVGWGLIGSGTVWLILVVLMSITLYDRHAGLIAYGVVVVTIASVTLLVRFNIIMFVVDFEAYAYSDVQWLTRAGLIILISSMIIASVGRVLDVLEQQIATFQENAKELAQREDDLSFEVRKRQTTEIALADAVTHLKDLDKLKNNFIDNVSHELRTPLANIQLYHQLLAMNPNKTKNYLETLKVETERLNHIVEQMIHASSDEYDMQLSTVIDVDLGEIIQRLFNEHSDVLAKRNIHLDLPDLEAPYLTVAAPGHIYRAIGNLVDNAVKYTPVSGNVTVEMLRDNSLNQAMVGLSISNTGACPSEQEKSQLFERFVRGTSSLEMGVAGAGLGLAISRQIVEKYGGNLSLKCEQETFIFTLCLPDIVALAEAQL